MVDKNFLSKLYENFDLKQREGLGGMKFKYIPSDSVIDRMNKVFHAHWCTEILEEKVIEDQILVRVRVTVTMPDSGDRFWHDGYGSASLARFKSGNNKGEIIELSNAYKSAESKAIRHACSRFGVGLFQQGEGEEYFDYDAPETSGDPNVVVDNCPPETNIPVGKYKMTGDLPKEAEAPPQEISAPLKTSNFPKRMPSMPSIPSVPRQEASIVQEPEPIEEEAPTKPGLPKIPNPAGGLPGPRPVTSAGPVKAQAPPTLPTASQETKDSGITDVQKAALEGILSIQGVEYDTLITQAFQEYNIECKDIPEINNLSYKQAVAAVKHGNALFRKQ